jgi:autotransporter-associated beta strand protein
MKSILHQFVSKLSMAFQEKADETIAENGLGTTPELFTNKRRYFNAAFFLSLVCMFAVTQSRAQLTINAISTANTQNFDGMGSTTTATLPTGFKVNGNNTTPDWATGTTATTQAGGTSGTGALTGTSGGGTYNFANGVTASATDRALGFLTSGSYASPNSLILKITNNTGVTINNLDITFDYEKYRAGTRAWNLTFFHGSATNPTTSNTSGDQAYGVDGANAVVNPPTTISKTVNLTGLSIANGASYYIKWTSTGLAGSTNSQGIAVDNFSITATTSATTTLSTSGTLAAVNTTYGTASASPTSFNVSGTNITGGILVSPPNGFEVSLASGGTYTSTVTVGTSGAVPSTPVFVRLKATATVAGSPYSGNIVCSTTGASNANVATVSSTVSPLAITITGATASNKIYNRTTAATITGATATGTVNSDVITVTGGGTFNNYNVGTAKPVTAALSLSGTNATSYSFTQPTGLSADITPKDLTVAGASANNKVYDGNTGATLSGTLSGVISPDDVSVIFDAGFNSPSVANAIPVTSFSSITGVDTGNYNFINPTGLSANITPRPLTIAGATAANKVYDGNTDAVINGTLTGVIEPDFVTFNGIGVFDSPEVGLNIPVTSVSIIEGDIDNYTLVQPTGLTANISAGELLSQTITFDPLAALTYGDANFTLTATSDSNLTVNYSSSDPSVATIVAGAAPGTFDVHITGVGFTTITATQSGDGTYDAAIPVDQVLSVSQKELIVTESAANKVYDGNDIAVVTGSLSGIVGSDDVEFVGAGNFITVGAGTAIDVYPNSTLGGTDAAKYFINETILTADITPKALTVTGAVASNKAYNGNFTAAITGAVLQGVIAPDVVTVSGGGTFASKNVANGIAVTAALALGGTNAGNYTLTQPTGLTANITAIALTISGLTGVDKVYDRTTAATLSGTAVLNGVIAPDDVTITGTPGAVFANKTVANAKPITVSGYTLGGADLANYSLTQPTGITANITPFSLTIFNAAAANKLFDGTTAATISGILVGTLGADVVTLIGTGTFATSAVGNNIVVTSTSTIGGADGPNYIINPQPTGLTANITSAPTVIASQDFEVVPATPTLTFTTTDVNTPGTSSGFTSGQTGLSTVDAPSASNLFTGGARGYRFQGPGSGTASRTLVFSTVDASAYTNLQVSFRVAGMSLGSNANGMDVATGTTVLGAVTPIDFALVEVSPDGGTTWYKQAIVGVTGTNVRWSFGATGSGSKAYAANDTYATFSTTGSGTITSGATAITTATVTSLPSSSALKIRITLETNSANESWIIDDVNITGTLGAACTTPDALTSLAASNGSSLSVLSWNYGSCYDDVLVVASTGAFTSAVPTGDGTAYTANSQSFTDVLNTAFDGGKVVYKGPAGGATITSLTNGTTYNFKVFVRKGTNWTTGDVTSATPVEAQYFWDADGATSAATGGTGTWDNSATSNWRTPNATGALAAWVTNTAPLNATIAGTAGTISIAAGTTFSNTTPNLYINTTGYTFATGSGTVTLPAINTVLDSGVNVTFAPNVNTTTPATGTLNVGNINGASGSGITITSAQNILGVAQRINLSRTNSLITVPITITSAGGTGSAAIAQVVAIATGTILSSAATITNNTAVKTGLGATSGFDITANGVISGSADLIFAASPTGGAGTVTLGAANTYTGSTLFNSATSGVIKLALANALPTTTNMVMGYSLANGGIFDLNGFNQTIGSLSSGAGGGSIRNNAAATDASLTVNGASSTTFGLAITDGTSKVALVKNGAGILTLSGTNTYTGGTTISGGSIQLGAAGVLANAGAITLNGGSLETGGFTETVGTLNLNSTGTIALGAGNHTLTFANSNAVSWAGSVLTVTGWSGTAGQSNTAGGKIQVGVGGLTPAQLAKISFTGYSGTPIILVSGELVPSGPRLVVTGTTDHGSACVGSAANYVEYTITNTGATAADILIVSNNAEFVVSNAPGVVSGGGSATYRVTFTPSASGVRAAAITITTSTVNSNSPVVSNITGTGNVNVTYYADTDNDTYGDLANAIISCTGVPAGYVSNNTDCNDSNASVYQSALLYTDVDADGYDAGTGTTSVCYGATVPAGYSATTLGVDCNDAVFSSTNNCSTSSVVNLTMMIQGYYLGGGAMNSVRFNQDFISDLGDVEMLTVELHDAETLAVVATTEGMLHTDGTLSAVFGTAPVGSYYIAVKGSNIIQTWSAGPQSVGSTPLSYDFTSGPSQAYGDNMSEVEPGVWAIFSGDINQDESIDLTDYSTWETDANEFAFGIYATDLSGDGSVDLTDYSIWEGNANNFIYAIYPTN